MIAWVIALSGASSWLQMTHGGNPATNNQLGGLVTLAMLVVGIVLQFLLMAVSIGGICRLIRDALRD